MLARGQQPANSVPPSLTPSLPLQGWSLGLHVWSPQPLCQLISPTSSQGCHRGSSRTTADRASEVNS